LSGRKVFTAGEVLQAADVNDYLMDQSVMVFAGTAARGSAIPSPTEGMVTYRSDDDTVEVFDGSAFVAVGSSSAILQVVSTTKTDTFSAAITANNAADVTGLSASITPSSTSSKILVVANVTGGSDSFDGSISARILRDSTAIGVGASAGSRTPVGVSLISIASNDANISTLAWNFLDSPNSTSSLTYKIQVQNVVASGATRTLYVNRNDGDSDSASIPRAASTITLMEVAG
jgi:hypothetical protein